MHDTIPESRSKSRLMPPQEAPNLRVMGPKRITLRLTLEELEERIAPGFVCEAKLKNA